MLLKYLLPAGQQTQSAERSADSEKQLSTALETKLAKFKQIKEEESA